MVQFHFSSLTQPLACLRMDATIKLISNAVSISKTKTVSRQSQVSQHPLSVRNVSDQAHFKLILLLIGGLKGHNTQLGGSQYEGTQHPSPFRRGVKKCPFKQEASHSHINPSN